MRKSIHLNFDWEFISSYQEKYITDETVFQNSEKVDIPHNVKELPLHDFDELSYQIDCSYQKHFLLESVPKSDCLYLHFAGVANVANVYLNGTFLGKHEGGFTPFRFDISDVANREGDNRLFVHVDTHEVKDVPPFGNVVDYLVYGGIYREVWIEQLPSIHIEKCRVKTRESLTLIPSEMLLDYSVVFNREINVPFQVTQTVYDETEISFSETYEEKSAFEFTHSILNQNIQRWNLDYPKLYRFDISIVVSGEIIDTFTTRFGYREAKFTELGFILNNQKIKLIGLNRHQSYPYVGYAMPKSMQASDADILKFDCGCNIVRTSHYMQSDHFINRCDEIGLLVFEEIPGWQYIGGDHFKELSLQNVRSMIEHHINHPSIVLWGTRINESHDDHEFYTMTSELAYELDDSRQIGGVRNFRLSELLEDVYTYNDFSHVGNNPGLENPRNITIMPVPYLVTEHNGHIFPTKKFDPESKRAEQAIRHMKVLDSAYQYENISGAIGWCLADYNTHKDFGSGDRICYHGVTDMFRIPKYAAYTYLSQQNRKPVLQVTSNMNIGEYSRSVIPEVVILTNCDYVKFYHNDRLVDLYYPNWQKFPNVVHAPVLIRDFIGKQLEEDGTYSPKIAKRIKKDLMSYNQYGFSMPLFDKLRFANLMLIHHLTMEDAMNIYGKYIGNWGSENSYYRFEGYTNNEMVVSSVRGQGRIFTLVAQADQHVLHHDDTYDVTRITVKLLDEFDNIQAFGNETILVKTTGSVKVLGPENVALSGGSTGIYIRSIKKGKGTVELIASHYPKIKISLAVE